jgi:hypothetical protein
MVFRIKKVRLLNPKPATRDWVSQSSLSKPFHYQFLYFGLAVTGHSMSADRFLEAGLPLAADIDYKRTAGMEPAGLWGVQGTGNVSG